MDQILAWLNPFNWIEGTLVELKLQSRPGVVYIPGVTAVPYMVTVSTYGRVTVHVSSSQAFGPNRVYNGWLKPALVYKLIDQYGLYNMEGDYSTHGEYWNVKLWTPAYGSWELQTDQAGPDGSFRFIKDVLNMVKELDTNSDNVQAGPTDV